MAGRFINPLPQFSDSTPTMYAGAKLFFYATGTSTKLNTYTTKALSVANPNPVVLNSAGRLPNDVFLQDLEYKVVLAPSTDSDPPSSPIWTADPVSHRDSLLVAKTLTGAGSPNGSVAGTAGSSSVLPDFYWDYTNSILYVCTTTGTSSTAVWTAINASSATPAVPPPQGRLTPTSATPVISTEVAAGTAVYYTSYTGNLVPIYNGSTMVPTEFSELTLSLVASHALNTIYDVFVFSNSGVLTLVTGPAWSNSAASAGSRGTGAGTTQLARVKGLWTNAVSMTARNGSTTYTVGANLGTYLGSIFIDGTAGQITCHNTYRQSAKWGIWNAYNRVPIILKAGDTTAGWTIGGGGSGAFRALNGLAANSLTTFSGLPEQTYDFSSYLRASFTGTTSQTAQFYSSIGVNTAITAAGIVGTYGTIFGSGVFGNFTVTDVANGKHFLPSGTIGINVITHIEAYTVSGASAPAAVAGGEASNLLTGTWLG
jgi:hypothetical protein